MIRCFLNASAATAGGGLTYVRNVLPEFAARPDIHLTVLAPTRLAEEFQHAPNLDVLEYETRSGALARLWHEQSEIPKLLRDCRADVLISAGNFALRSSPVPQILLARNSLYLSADFFSDLLHRREYGMWFDTKLKRMLAKASIRWSDVTAAPTHAFAEELTRWTARRVRVISHGFDPTRFLAEATPLPDVVLERLSRAGEGLKLLFVSHYNYYRNFETLFRALPKIIQFLAPTPVTLVLTCKLSSGANPGSYKPDVAFRLVRQLGLENNVVELGTIAYDSLAQLYKACDLYITPAYAETFAHPLVEAMACGLPILAADIPVHREICGDAAAYFPPFSPEALASHVVALSGARERRQQAAAVGRARYSRFSWKKHVDELVSVARELLECSRVSRADEVVPVNVQRRAG